MSHRHHGERRDDLLEYHQSPGRGETHNLEDALVVVVVWVHDESALGLVGAVSSAFRRPSVAQ